MNLRPDLPGQSTGIIILEPNELALPPRLDHARGVIMVLFAAVLWGVSGSAAQILFQHHHVSPAWLVHVRTLVSGILLLAFVIIRRGPRHVLSIWVGWRNATRLLTFALLGLTGVQYTYFAAIQASNAATATLLQYLAPVLVVIWVIFRTRARIRMKHVVSVCAAILGTGLLVTNGHVGALGISVSGLVWGLISAFELAFCSIYPARLVRAHGSLLTTGWSMTIGGIAIGFWHPFWQVQGTFTTSTWGLVAFVILFGTMISFAMFSASLKMITSEEASLLSCAEPLASALFAVLFLHLYLHVLGWTGAILILVAVGLLSKSRATHSPME